MQASVSASHLGESAIVVQRPIEDLDRQEAGRIRLCRSLRRIAQLIVAVVLVSLDRRVLDRPVHPLHVAVRPGMVWLGQPVLDAVRLTDVVEAHRPGDDRVPVPRLLCELDAVVGGKCVDLVGHGLKHALPELPSGAPDSLLVELGHRELARAVNADKEIELALGGLHVGDVDVEEADRVGLELLPLRLVTLDIRQTRDAVPL